MYILMEATAASAAKFPVYFTAVYVVGFIAAVTLGSLAWYNSKRPPGWEGQDRPNYMPKVNTEEDSETK